jgi:hypothetical protein
MVPCLAHCSCFLDALLNTFPQVFKQVEILLEYIGAAHEYHLINQVSYVKMLFR